MLVVSRRVDERIVVGDNITIVVNRIAGKRVTLGVEAPDDVRILRGELEPVAKAFDEPAEDRAGRSARPAPPCHNKLSA